VATDRGVSRFDGRNWNPDVLPDALNMARESGSLKASPSGALWVNRSSRRWNRRAWPKAPPLDTSVCDYWTVCYQLERSSPRTSIVLGPQKVSQPGDITISWKGTDPWHETRDADLQFSFRLDDRPWSPFTGEQAHAFSSLPSGRHHFEVRSRDHAFNVDPNPATLNFEVVPPVWRQAWFVGLMVLLTGVIVAQSIRMIGHARHLRRTNRSLAAEIEERKRIELKVENTHKQLLRVSRQAGMAEVATGVLHNVGNVLNSVNVSATLLNDQLEKSQIHHLQQAAGLLHDHLPDLAGYLASDPKGKLLPEFLIKATSLMATEQKCWQDELKGLRKNVEHMKEIVAMQQNYASVAGIIEVLPVRELVEDALQINAAALARHRVQVVREYTEVPPISVDKHKVIQILINFIRNAKYAMDHALVNEKRLTVRIGMNGAERVSIAVRDNGIGIPQENLTRIFSHGFTTKKDGHGFGLHSGALAAKELGGTLTAHSDGPGKGACFTLELPVSKPKN
jgi:signal transduction histidine kinase